MIAVPGIVLRLQLVLGRQGFTKQIEVWFALQALGEINYKHYKHRNPALPCDQVL